MTDRVVETFSAPVRHRIDAILGASELLGPRALTVYAACASCLHLGGDVAECGVAGGETAAGLAKLLRSSGRLDVWLHLFDTFGTCAIAGRNNLAAQAIATHARAVDDVRKAVNDGGHDFGDVFFHPGLFSDTLPKLVRPLCFLHSDGDLYESTRDVIALADRLVLCGGMVVFDDYGTEWTGVTRAVDELLSADTWFTYAVKGYGQLVAVRRS